MANLPEELSDEIDWLAAMGDCTESAFEPGEFINRLAKAVRAIKEYIKDQDDGQ